MTEATEIKVTLTAGSVLDFADVLADIMDHIDPSMLTKAKDNKDDSAVAEIGMSVMKLALKHGRKSTFAFLAGAAGMTTEELARQPATAITEIINQIKDSPDLADFFTQVRGMLK